MSAKNAKFIILCTARSQKPLRLTAGNFCDFGYMTLNSVSKYRIKVTLVKRKKQIQIFFYFSEYKNVYGLFVCPESCYVVCRNKISLKK